MSYPYDLPSLSMSTTWISGNFKPTDVTKKIINNFTPVNKLSMTNSVGNEISLIQNYINSKFLGRDELPIQSGYITQLKSNSGYYYIYNSGSYDVDNSITINPSSIILYHEALDPYNITEIIRPTGVYIKAINGFYETNRRIIDFNLNKLYMHGVDPSTLPEGSISWDTNFIPYSGLNINRTDLDIDACTRMLDVSISGIKWGYTSYDGLTSNVTKLDVNSSGNIIVFPSGQFVISSGVPYVDCGLTVGNINGGGNVFIQTKSGGGVFIGGLNNIDSIISYATNRLLLQCGSSDIKLYSTVPKVAITGDTIIDNHTLVVSSGQAYTDCGITIGNDNYSGNMFIRTSAGGGILLKGDNGMIDRLQTFGTSTVIENQGGVVNGSITIDTSPENSGIVFVTGDSTITIPGSGTITLPVNATDPTSSYALTNAIKDVLIKIGFCS
ncbi:MAG: hypothetical protein M0R17_02415 [Candidatus Omnitrophica bacterium]|jgi:hypothetical protein|nr:hypothetical protein [Candidatus Omnitrophota bacterium]